MKLSAGKYYGATTQALYSKGIRYSEQIYPAGAHYSPHSHELSHLCFAISGSYNERIGRQNFERDTNSIMFYPPDTDHTETHSSVGRHLLVEIGSRRFLRFSDYGLKLNQPVTLDRDSIIPAIRMYGEFVQPDEFSKLILESALLELLVAASRKRDANQTSPKPCWMKTVKEFLESNLNSPPFHSKIQPRSPVFIQVISSECLEHTNTVLLASISVLLGSARLEMLLLDLTRPCVKSLQICSFSDQKHFTRTFRTATGIPPGKVRKLAARLFSSCSIVIRPYNKYSVISLLFGL